jgi:3',5'-cyclic AMP phosphodiesterase CpdA
MNQDWKRRDFLALIGLGGVVFASGLSGCGRAKSPESKARDFFFLQLSDTHWGFRGPPNPEAETCLKKTILAINASPAQPDFVVFTGDLTHTTGNPGERRARMAQFRELVAELKVQKLVFLPGEHDAAPDRGDAYREAFGETHQAFEHEGVSFITLDNASAPAGALGEAQLDWLSKEVARVPATSPLVVLAHRPLFDLYPEWDWATEDGARAIGILGARPSTTVFYGHIHQEHHHVTGRVHHHSARSLIFPLPPPGSAPQRVPLPWDPKSADHGLGYRRVSLAGGGVGIEERPFG